MGVVVAALVAVGVGAVVSAPGRAVSDGRSEPPSQPPPRVAGAGPAPPPAWVETVRGSRWLAFSSFCWSRGGKSRCTDFFPESMRTDVPRIRVEQGERVRLHLGFEAREVLLSMGGKRKLYLRRTATRTIAWRVSGIGLIGLLAYARGGGSASYVARFR